MFILTSEKQSLMSIKEAELVYVMGRQITLLSTKVEALSKDRNNACIGLVVSMLTDKLSVEPHEVMIRLMSLR